MPACFVMDEEDVIALSRQCNRIGSWKSKFIPRDLSGSPAWADSFAGLLGNPVCQLCQIVEIHSACQRACCTISTKTLRVSAGLLTSRKNAMWAPRMPSRVFMRT